MDDLSAISKKEKGYIRELIALTVLVFLNQLSKSILINAYQKKVTGLDANCYISLTIDAQR